MRAVIFLAIVGVAFGLNICKGVDQGAIDDVWSAARTGAAAILGGSCPSFNLDAVAFSGECRSLVRQATCYGIKAEDRYSVDVVNYGLLAGDVKNIKALGNLACTDVAGCFGQVRDAIQTCMTENANFVQDTIDTAEAIYKKDFEAEVKAFAAKNSGSLLGDLASMAMDQFTSADDIRTFIESHITDDVVADAEAAGTRALEMAQDWCDNGCTDKTAAFLKGIFGHMNGGGCVDASVFCGECQARAASYFTKKTLPCCIENVVQEGIKAYDYVVKNYSGTLAEYAAGIETGLSATAIAEAEAARDSFVEQFSCVRAVYSANQPEC